LSPVPRNIEEERENKQEKNLAGVRECKEYKFNSKPNYRFLVYPMVATWIDSLLDRVYYPNRTRDRV